MGIGFTSVTEETFPRLETSLRPSTLAKFISTPRPDVRDHNFVRNYSGHLAVRKRA